MFEIINTIAMLATIALGLFGWLAPRYTMKKVGLESDETNMGYTEVRAASGALFVFAGLGALLLFHPIAFATVGCMYLGASIGRITGILADKAGTSTAWSFFAAEAILAIVLIAINLL